MAKTQQAVVDFLNDLHEKLLPLGRKELGRLLELKQTEMNARNEPFDGKINSWDYGYYMRLLEEHEYKIDQNKIKEYFPLENTTRQMLDIYQNVLGLKFTKSKLPVWHADVEAFQVHDSGSGELVGTFFMDLFPRGEVDVTQENKYKHAACFPLKASYTQEGTRIAPVAALVCNFAKPTADRPSLLKHEEVVTFFHELGIFCLKEVM